MAQLHRRPLPVGQLMTEHRLTDHMIRLFRVELDRIGQHGRIDSDFIDSAVSYMREFADICHHGKEERILFAKLEEKSLPADLRTTMDDLIQEHILMRKLSDDLVEAKERYVRNEPNAKADIIASINILVELYPSHMEKEDKHFFMPTMGYLSDDEKNDMLDMFYEFDSRLFHDGYRAVVAGLEDRWGIKPGVKTK